MKSYVYSAMLAALAAAGAKGSELTWSYELPETGLMPSAFSYDFTTSMRERHGGESHFAMHEVSLTIPLSDPRQSSVEGWRINAELNTAITFVDAEGSLSLESDTLYKINLPFSLIRTTQAGHRYIVAAVPTIASDLECAERCFDFGLFGAYTHKVSDTFSFTVGLAAYPRFARNVVMPLLGFEWKPVEDWTIRLKYYRLSAMKDVTERFRAGAFLGAEGGIWSVDTDRGSRMLNVRSFVMGVTGEYDFSRPGQRKRIITASLGSTLATSVRFHEWRGNEDADESHHYRPGLYASVGLDFRF